MLNIIKGFVAPKATVLETNVTLNTKDVTLVNLDSDVSIVIDALIDINNKALSNVKSIIHPFLSTLQPSLLPLHASK